MRVWYILMTFPFETETFVANDVRALMRLGIQVSVHALRGRKAYADRLLDERGLTGLPVTHGTCANILRGVVAALMHPLVSARTVIWVITQSRGSPVHLIKGLLLVPRILGLFAHLEDDPPDVVHIYWGHYPAIFGWLVLEYAPDIVLSLSLSAYDLLRDFPGSSAVARRAHLVSTWAATNVPAIAALGVTPATVHVSWQGLDVEQVEGHRLEKLRHRIVTVGRLIADKGMDDVIRAFARVRSQHPDAELVILGDGADRRRLEHLAVTLGVGNSITFRGHVPHHEVFQELATATLFLFLSRYAAERLPNVVREAMACRCVVVTTDTPGIDELMENAVHGWIVPQGAWERAAERAIAVLSDPDAARGMAAAAQSHVLTKFNSLHLMHNMVCKWGERGAARARAASARVERSKATIF
jgi:glycosyltransferase involved in cell wall biosynthesis